MGNHSLISVTANTLTGIDLFRDLSVNDRSLVAQHCKGKHFDAHQQILSQKDLSRDVYFVITGTVRVTFFSKSGKEITFRDQNAGEMFGELSAIDGKPRSSQVLTRTDVILVSISSTKFQNLLRENSLVTYKVMQHLTGLVRLLSDRVIEFSTLSVNNRIHSELLRLSLKGELTNGSAIIAPVPTHSDIANRISTHREAITRELNVLEHSGLIQRHHDKWVVIDVERLQNMVIDVMGD